VRLRCISEPQSPRQAEDAEEGKKLLAQDQEALIKAAKEGDGTKVGRVMAPLLTIPVTFNHNTARELMLAHSSRLPAPPAPRSEVMSLGTQHSRLGRCGS